MDVRRGVQLFHIEVFKVTSMVCGEGGQYVKATDKMVKDELGDMNSSGVDKKDYFNPLFKVVCGGEDPFMAFGR